MCGAWRKQAHPGKATGPPLTEVISKQECEAGQSYRLHRDIPVGCGKEENTLEEKGQPISHLLLQLGPSRPECMNAGFQEPPSHIHALSSSADLYS